MVAWRHLLGSTGARRPRAVLSTAGATHFLHDGFTDVIYLLLPIWQAELGLTLAQTGVLKSCYSGALAACQVPAGLLAERLGERAVLMGGTIVAGLGFVALGSAAGFLALALTLLLAGAGSGVQHPLNATVVANAYPDRGRRAALGIYNFTGDLGKIAVPMLAALVITVLDWQAAATGYGLVGVAVAVIAFLLMRALGAGGPPAARRSHFDTGVWGAGWGISDRRGFATLSAIGVIDSIGRTGFLTFLPFLLIAKGADVATIGLALGLTFTGGAAGKFLCGVLAERVGILRTVILTELTTAAGILVLLPLPLAGALTCLPVVGLALNGTSSVLYATVAEFVAAERRARGFGLFYTLGIGAGASAPFAFGALADLTSVPSALTVVALLVLLTIPLSLRLRRSLARDAVPGVADARPAPRRGGAA
jgi:FSR family fosmidomycin resistance protein-like MFS transporter